MGMSHRTRAILAALCAACGAPAVAASGSMTLAAYAESEGGRSYALDGRFSPVARWTLGARVSRSESDLEGAGFSGTGVAALTNFSLGSFFAGVSADRWKDSGQVRSDRLQAEMGWMADSGVSFSVLVVDRMLRVQYSTLVLDQTVERDIDFDGTGWGFDLAYYGAEWTAGARFTDYDYGHSVARVRNALQSASTERFPALDSLVWSIATRAAGAPEREFSFTLGRQFPRSSVALDVQLQRDAIFREDTWSLGLSFGREFGRRVLLDIMAGFTNGRTIDTIPWGGVALTLRSPGP